MYLNPVDYADKNHCHGAVLDKRLQQTEVNI